MDNKYLQWVSPETAAAMLNDVIEEISLNGENETLVEMRDSIKAWVAGHDEWYTKRFYAQPDGDGLYCPYCGARNALAEVDGGLECQICGQQAQELSYL